MFNLNPEKIRSDFPIFDRKINGKEIIYFDNAATTQKPKQVLESIMDFYKQHNANIHRGVHRLSREASDLYEQAHRTIGKFINAKQKEIIFTRNTTESLNLIYYSLSKNLKKGDEIITTLMEHHSNIVPLLELQKLNGIKVKFIDVNEDGTLDLNQYKKEITKRTKIITVAHSSNVLGTINPVEKIEKLAHENNSLFIVDAAQSAPHIRINFRKLNADFIAFSAHKMLGPTGIGALAGKKDLLEKMPAFLLGGDMIQEVHKNSWKPNKLPWKFEAGTPNIAGGVGFAEAVKYLEKIGIEKLRKHEKELAEYALARMKAVNNIEIYGPMNVEERTGIISFNMKNVSAHELAGVLDSMNNIMLRSGMLCAQPLVEGLDKKGVARISFYIYNTEEEIDIFISSLNKITC
ncbi:cysteine desulfurase [Candidatus Woesearchaeota archaeon]|nr:cysteine desulfurase [Candidatus Woesearchaeota archaeon]